MTGNFKKLIESVQGDIVLIDMMYQWANNPTTKTALFDKGGTPDHGLIKKNLQVRYALDKEGANSYFEKFKNLVDEADFNFNSGYLDATLFVNEYLNLNPVLKLETLSRLASATPKEGQIVWLYCKFKDQWLQYSLGSNFDENRDNSKKTLKKFVAIFKIVFDKESEPYPNEIISILIKLGFINELDWITSTHKEFHPYIFSSYLDDIAKDIDKYINIKSAII